MVASLFGWQKLPHGQGYSSILRTIRFHSEAEVAFQLMVELRQVAAVYYYIPPQLFACKACLLAQLRTENRFALFLELL